MRKKKKAKKLATKPSKSTSVSNKIAIKSQSIPRHKEKYPALNPKRAVKNRKELLEDVQEYVHLLSEEEKEWLNRFLEETVVTNFQHKGKLLYKKQADKRALWRENNARNKCIYTASRVGGKLDYIYNNEYLDSIFQDQREGNSVNTNEDDMIAMVDLKTKFKKAAKED